MHYTIKQLLANDIAEFTATVQLFAEVFETQGFQMPDEDQLQAVLTDKNFVAFSAFDGSTVIGGLTAYTLPSYYSSQAEIFVYDIAVQSIYQRQGVGKQLLDALSVYCSENGCKGFFVMAEEADIHALDFYRSANGDAQRVTVFNFNCQDLNV